MKKPACSFHFFSIAALLCAGGAGSAAPVTLLRDSFNGTGTPSTVNLNYNLSGRQSGVLGLIPYTAVGNVQVGNGGEPHDGGNVLLCAFAANAAALNYNFNNARSAGGLTISFDLDPNAHNNADASNWGAVSLGASEANRTTFVNGGTPHFSILIRANGKIQAFDGGTVLTSPTEPNWAPAGNYSLQFHHFDLVITGPGDGNPFDGAGDTQIDVYVDGGAVPVYSFTKVGGYADDYINFQSSDIADFDNLAITANNPPTPPSDPWRQVAWAGDLDSDIDASYTYTHAYNFGSANSPTINGVTFTGVNSGNPSVGGSFSVTGIPNVFGDDGGANVSGSSITLARSFIYGGTPGTLTLQGLVPGRQYLLTLYTKAWDASGNRIIRFSAGADQRVIDQDSYGRNDSQRNGLRITYAYIADGSGTLTVTMTPVVAANTFHFYGFSNREGAPAPSSAWQYSEWTSDASSGVSTAYYYTHAYNLGSGNSVILNNLTFAGQGAQNPTVPGVFSLANFFGFYGGGYTPEISGAGIDLARQFIYDGRPGTLTLNGLVPGRRYVLSLYSASFGPPGRLINFLANGDLQTIDQDAHTGARGIVISFPYTADAGGSLTARFVTVNPNWSFHLCGFANREESLATTPRILTQPADATVALGDTATFSFVVAAAAPVTYQWYLGVDPIPSAMSATLQVHADFPDVAGAYRVIASNAFGSITSRVAMLTVRLPVPGLFDTGVDNNRSALSDASIDPHYSLIVNPDSASPNAIVEDSTGFPIVTGPWVANTATSKWIGPRFNSAGAAGLAVGNGTYVYRTTFDLTGLDLATIVITGTWATDNGGLNIRVNGVDANITSPDFLAFYPFTLNSGNATFGNGVNTLDFVVQNADAAAGYTGLRVANLRGTASLPSTPPSITVQPQGLTAGTGENIGFTVSATGSSPLNFQWKHEGTNVGPNNAVFLINNVDHSHAGTYVVTVSNPFGSVTSSNAVLIVRDTIPGFFNTGVEDSRVALADGTTDPHYSLVVNPDGASPNAIVEDSTVFPIVAGPWVANDSASKWIGPRVETSQAAGGDSPAGDYTYRLNVDLTGFEASTIEVSGEWASDNTGLDILVNGHSTGLGNAGQFVAYTAFRLTNGFTPGPNTIDFKLNNAALGYTGLRVRNLRGLGTLLPPGTAPFIVSQPQDVIGYLNQTAVFRVIANGSTPLTYQWFYEGFPIPGENGPSLNVAVDFPDVAGHYKVQVSNGAGMVASREAILAINTVPTVPMKGGATSKDTPMSISSTKLLLGVVDPDGDSFALDSVATTSASGGFIIAAGAGLFTYTPPAGFTGTDTFTFNVRDSRGGIGVGTVEVLVLSGTLASQNQIVIIPGPSSVLVRFAGIPGRNYHVQRSADLNNWTTLVTVPAPLHGIIEYHDPMVLPAAFYRTAAAP